MLSKTAIVQNEDSTSNLQNDFLNFYSIHHNYRKGSIREKYIPKVPENEKLFDNATLKPGKYFDTAIYEDVIGISCIDENRNPVKIEMMESFFQINFNQKILLNLKKMKISQPLPIQCFLVPFILNYQNIDIIASSPTGSGKTLAIILPLIQLCIHEKQTQKRPLNAPFAVIIGATRDLVYQLALDCLRIGKDTGIHIKSAYGEYQRDKNVEDIQQGCDILVATTGRFVDLVEKKDVLINHTLYLIVDEVDKLVSDELIQDLQIIMQNRIHPNVTHIVFSATFTSSVFSILKKILRKKHVVVNLKMKSISPTVEQKFYDIDYVDRKNVILNFLKENGHILSPNELTFSIKDFMNTVQYRVPKTIIYADSRRTLDYLAIFLSMNGIRSISMHGGRSQSQRSEAWNDFMNDNINVLCASNVAARGINFPKYIINYDTPEEIETYIQRIGRAGRLGNKATAITFINKDDIKQMKLASYIVPMLKNNKQKCPRFLKAMNNKIQFGN